MRLTCLRDDLRAATRCDHERVDAAFGRFGFAGRDDYVAFLAAHARALPPLEAALEAAGARELLPDWPERLRTDVLKADLVALGAPEPAPGRVGPEFHGAAAVLGGLYVLEGSRLGARMLARAAAASPDPRVRAAVGFLSHGERRRFWPAFLTVLEGRPEPRDDIAALHHGARTAFRWYEAAAIAD